MLKISGIEKNAVALEYGFEVGDTITEFDGFVAQDVLDYLYYDMSENFTVTVLSKTGEVVKVEIEKEVDESLGLYFENDNLEIKRCQNNCVFCFVDQMPKGMRKSLYVKDDDYRQSFMTGNFVTLTNVTDSDIDRIIRLNLSPLYVSVQAMDGEVRKKLLNNRFAGDIKEKLKKLTQNGIKIDTQIVLVPSLNDGAVLENSLNELYKLRPNLKSVAVVPCGITKYRQGLYKIADITSGYARCVIEQVRNFNKKVGENFALLADEFYFKAGLEVESYEHYGDFSQIGNGVGGTREFLNDFNLSLQKTSNKGSFLLVTGKSAGEFIDGCAKKACEYIKGITVKTVAVENKFFGETVNCTGLLTAGDILFQISNELDGVDYIVLPDVCLKQDEDVFLDDITLLEFKNKINKPIVITDGSGQSFFDALSGGDRVRIIK